MNGYMVSIRTAYSFFNKAQMILALELRLSNGNRHTQESEKLLKTAALTGTLKTVELRFPNSRLKTCSIVRGNSLEARPIGMSINTRDFLFK